MAVTSMSSIPHDQSSADTMANAHGGVAAWLWALLLGSLIGTLLFMGYRATHGNQIISKPDVAAVTLDQPDIAPAPAVFNQGAEPLADNPMPQYPAALLAAGVEGDVIARLQIDATGAVTEANILARDSGVDARFEQAAIEALLQWRFRPEVRQGHAVSSVVQVPVEFRRER